MTSAAIISLQPRWRCCSKLPALNFRPRAWLQFCVPGPRLLEQSMGWPPPPGPGPAAGGSQWQPDSGAEQSWAWLVHKFGHFQVIMSICPSY